MVGSPKCYDFRITRKSQLPFHEDVIAVMNSKAKRFCFQYEQGDDTLLFHIQGRCSFKTEKTKAAASLIMKGLAGKQGSYFVEPTVKAVALAKDEYYVMKDDTRIDGPWTDRNVKRRYQQKRFRNSTMKPWQQKLWDHVKDLEDDRHIIFVKDEGNAGKSWLRGWMFTHSKKVINVPTNIDQEDQVGCFITNFTSDGDEIIITMDVPRGTSPKRWFALCRTMKTIKQGFLFNWKNNATERVIEPPIIICFCNDYPPVGALTEDVIIKWEK